MPSKHFSNNIIHAPHKSFVFISLLFNSMLTHGVLPDEMLLGTITPIVKNRHKSVNESSNYRAITLSSILGKLFDIIILNQNRHIFKSLDQQFGFKPKHSTTACTFILRETAQYYNNRGSNLYCLLLDASQAFDRVHYIKLFKLLLKRGLCFVSARFLLSLYTRQKLRVKWEHTLSCEFFVKNGVKQGGVLSPLLFAVYIDELLLQLQASEFGSYIGHYFVGALAYADDVTLLGPTLTSIKLMLNVVKTFGARYDVMFNASKTKLTKFGNRNDISKEFVEFNDNCIRCESSACHLGNNIGFNMERDNLSKSINEFVSKITRIKASFSYADTDVLYKLLKSYCMPLYGCALWDFSKKYVSRFFITWRKSVRYLLNLPYKTHSRLLSRIVGDKAIEAQLHCRFVKYLVSLHESDNVLLKY